MPDGPSAVRGFLALVRLTIRRQFRFGAMGWSTLLLIGLLTAIIAMITVWGSGWDFESSWSGRYRIKFRDYPVNTLDRLQMLPMPAPALGIEMAVYGSFRAQLVDEQFRSDYAFANYSRWVVFGLYVGFLLPLMNLAFASHAIGGERESRTMIWLLTRPLPRPAIYLAKWLGLLPGCVLISVGGLVLLGLAGGPVGREAAIAFTPAAVIGSVAFASFFHLVGSVIRRPAVMGLAYIFFFETLVANLPGSLKQLSLNYYVKSLMYDVTNRNVRALSPEALDLYAPTDPTTAWGTLLVASAALTVVGAWWFGRAEPTEDA